MRRAILGAVAILGACTASSGSDRHEARPTAQRSFEVAGFDSIELTGSHDVVVSVGAAPSVRAEGDAEALQLLEVEVEGGRLRIGSRNRGGWSWAGSAGRVTVHVTVPSLREAAVAGSGDVRIDRVEGPSFLAAIDGSGDLEVQTLRVEQATFSIAGSGNVRAAGAAGRAAISVAGSGDLDLTGLDTRAAEVRVMGAGDAQVRATQSASVTLMGSGDVTVTGGARCSIEKHGSGDVRCG
ncbi:MAG TPA: head GIN domain-containing protein [Allosphingosinicella sp.]|nr:head GIN domain-containing protein [Allosphingosinicella sp.]